MGSTKLTLIHQGHICDAFEKILWRATWLVLCHLKCLPAKNCQVMVKVWAITVSVQCQDATCKGTWCNQARPVWLLHHPTGQQWRSHGMARISWVLHTKSTQLPTWLCWAQFTLYKIFTCKLCSSCMKGVVLQKHTHTTHTHTRIRLDTWRSKAKVESRIWWCQHQEGPGSGFGQRRKYFGEIGCSIAIDQ